MSIQTTFEGGVDFQQTNFSDIHAAHRAAEAMGLVSPNRLPVGSVTLAEVVIEPIDLDGVLPEVATPVTRRTNGYDGISKTHRRTPFGQRKTETEAHAVLDAIVAFDESVAEQLAECETPRWTWVEVDEDGKEVQVIEYRHRSPEDVAYEQAHILSRADATRESLLTKKLREQPYAKDFRAGTTQEERARADAVLRSRKAAAKGWRRNSWR